MRKVIFVFILVLLYSAGGYGQSSFSAALHPKVFIPLGDSTDYYKMGFGTSILGEYLFTPLWGVRSEFDLNIVPTFAQTNLNLFVLSVGPKMQISLPNKLSSSVYVTGGWYLGTHEGGSGNNPFLKGGVELLYNISPALEIGFGVQYNHFFTDTDPLLSSLSIDLGASYHFGRSRRPPGLKIKTIDIPPLFPVFYKYYDDHPLGEVVIINEDREALNDISVSFFVNQFMEQAKKSILIETLKPGEEKGISLNALFFDSILEITESTKVTAQILIEYSQQDSLQTAEQSASIRIYDRNAMTWDDDRKAAAYITAKDPEILVISKRIAGMTRGEGNDSLPSELKVAIGLLEGLRTFDIQYVPDPKTPYIEYSENSDQIDFLQFPRQTLLYKAGDCDDLSILYCSLLESVGIETAFITIPGHIYMAFSPTLSSNEAERIFTSKQNYFVEDQKVWIPVEVTALHKGFLEAWQTGAAQWHKYRPKDEAEFFPIHQAWQLYEPVGFISSKETLDPLDEDQLGTLFHSSLTKLRAFLFEPKLVQIRERITADPDNIRLRNNLGLLYARFGRYEEAEKEFMTILSQKEYSKALINLGHLYFLRENYVKAQDYYLRAQRQDPYDTHTLLALLKTNIALSRFTEAEGLFDTIKRLDPQLATRYAYLQSQENTERAANKIDEETVIWADD